MKICTYSQSWPGAEVVGIGDDTFGFGKQVVIVRHPHFQHDLDFYAEAESDGKRYNVGNCAFWLEDE